MARPKKKKEDKELVDLSIQSEKQVEAPEVEAPEVEAPARRTTKEVQEALLLNYSKITLRKRGLLAL
jgi:hypothetical protein